MRNKIEFLKINLRSADDVKDSQCSYPKKIPQEESIG